MKKLFILLTAICSVAFVFLDSYAGSLNNRIDFTVRSAAEERAMKNEEQDMRNFKLNKADIPKIEQLIATYGKSAIVEYIRSRRGSKSVTVDTGAELKRFPHGEVDEKYITVKSILYDLKDFELTPKALAAALEKQKQDAALERARYEKSLEQEMAWRRKCAKEEREWEQSDAGKKYLEEKRRAEEARQKKEEEERKAEVNNKIVSDSNREAEEKFRLIVELMEKARKDFLYEIGRYHTGTCNIDKLREASNTYEHRRSLCRSGLDAFSKVLASYCADGKHMWRRKTPSDCMRFVSSLMNEQEAVINMELDVCKGMNINDCIMQIIDKAK